MRKLLFFVLLMFSSIGVGAETVPTLLILTTTSDEISIPIASIKTITYDKAGTIMYVNTNAGTNSYAVADITRMTLTDVPEPTAISQLTVSPIDQLTKIVKDGVVYVVKDGKLFTMKGEPVQ